MPFKDTQYDDGTDLQTLTDGYYTINYIYRGVEEQNHAYLVLGNQEYAWEELALASHEMPDPPEIISSHAVLVGRVIIQKNATNGIMQSAFHDAFQTDVLVSTHSLLSNLSADDHQQYAMLAGRLGGQVFIGGTGNTDDLIFRTTANIAASGSDMIFQTGDNGNVEAMRILSDGTVNVATKLGVLESSGATYRTYFQGGDQSGNITYTLPVDGMSTIGLLKNTNGVWSWDTTAYLTGNQSISLTGAVTGSGTTSIATSLAINSVAGTNIALGSDVAGDIMYYDGTDYVRLAGDTGFLKSTGAFAPTWATLALSDISVPVTGSPTIVTDLGTAYDYMWSAGVISGGDITDNSDGTVDISSGEAILRTTNSETAPLKSIVFPAINDISMTDGATNYLWVNYNGGTPQVEHSTVLTDFNCMDKCHLYTVTREGTKLFILDGRKQNIDANRKLRRKNYETNPFAHVSGGTALSDGNRNLEVSAGAFWYSLEKINHGAFDTSLAGTSSDRVFETHYRDGSNGWVDTYGEKQIDNTQYDDGDGTLGTLTDGYYGVHWVYLTLGMTQELMTIYGRGDYATLTDAKTEGVPQDIPSYISGAGVLIGRVIIQKNASSIDFVESAFSNNFSPAGLASHGSLAGLTIGDDHMQYAFLGGRTGGQIMIGGTGTTDDLILRTTAGSAASGANMIFQTGDNGSIEAINIGYNGTVNIATKLGVLESTGAAFHTYFQGGDQAADITYTLPINGMSTTGLLKNTNGVWSWDTTAYQDSGAKDQPNGYAGLDANGLVPYANVVDLAYIRDSEISRFCSGLSTGGSISVNGTSDGIDITAGTGFVNDHTGVAGTYKKVTWDATTDVAPVGSGTNYIAINANGVVNISLTQQTMANHIYLGHFYSRDGNDVMEVFAVPEWTQHFFGRVNEWMRHAMGALVAEGLTVAEKANPNELELNIAAGEFYARLGEFTVSATSNFTKMYNSADNGWLVDSSSANHVNVTQWNDQSQNEVGALVTMTDNYWKKDMLIATPNGNIYYVFGQAEYATEDEAKLGSLPVVSPAITEDTVNLATIVSQKGDTSIANRLYDIRPYMDRVFGYGTSGGGSTSDHGILSGLSDDDHTQYALLAGRDGGQSLTGGITTTSDLTFKTTSANAISGADMIFETGNNGSIEAMNINYDGTVNIATKLGVLESTGATFHTYFQGGDQTGDITYTLPTTSSNGLLKNTGGVLSWDTSTYLTSYTETDPIFSASAANGIAGTDITNWDTAYGWGNHAVAGYITDGNTNWDNSYGFITGNQSITLSGDISGTGTTDITTSIGNNKVTGAMIALGSDAAGDMMYYNGTDYVRLGEGTNDGYVLKINTTTHAPYWAAATGGVQTPWAQDISAAGYDLGNLSNLGFQETTGAPTGTDVGLYRDNSGDLSANVLTGKNLNVAVNGTDEYNFSSTGLAFNSNNITGLGTNLTAASTLTIASAAASGLTINSGTTGAIAIGDDASAETITIGTGAAAKTLTIGSTNTTSATTIQSGSGGIVLNGTTTVANATDFVTSNLGVNFTDSDTNPSCAAGDYKIYADTSDGRLKKCQNGTVSDLAQDTDVYNRAKSADQSVTNSTVLTDETALQFPIGATEEWNVIWNLMVTNNNSLTPDWKAAVVGPTSNTCTALQSGAEPTGSAFPQAVSTNCSATPTAMVNGTIAADANIPLIINITANIIGGGTAGTVNLQFAENTAGVGTSITVKAGSVMNAYRVTGADLAEFYYTKDETLMAGDVVALDSALSAGVKKTSNAYDSATVGVISTKPGVVLGDSSNGEGGYPALVALSGRVPVKVSTENGPINPGDMLTASSMPGVAMKATKNGSIIGMAMTGYDNIGIGAVTVFIKTTYFTGSKVLDLAKDSQSAEIQTALGNSETSKAALLYMLEQKQALEASGNLSEIFTDRIAAGLEIITPKVTAETVGLDKIEAATGLDVAMNISDGGAFKINNAATGENGITFDNAGNAIFQGTLTADAIVANKILGLEIFTNQISGIDENVSALADKLNILQTTEESIDLSTLGILEKKGGLAIAKETTFKEATIFEKLVTLLGNVVFHGKVSFEKVPTFNADMAGYAVIKEGADKVIVTFNEEYANAPIVNASLSLQNYNDKEVRQAAEELLLVSDVKYIITNITTKGFEIRIDQEAASDVRFSWQVLAVKDAKTFESKTAEKTGDNPETISEIIPPEPVTTITEVPAPITGTPVTEAAPAVATDEMVAAVTPAQTPAEEQPSVLSAATVVETPNPVVTDTPSSAAN